MSDLVKVQSAAAQFISRRRGPRVSVPSSISVRSISTNGPDIVAIKEQCLIILSSCVGLSHFVERSVPVRN